IVPTPPHTPDPTTLRLHLAQHLPDYMIPTTYVTLDTLPLNPNGKVDPHALPKPFEGVRISGAAAPITRTEKALVEIWENLLGVDEIGIDDNFFELGGHSLLATQVVSRIRNTLDAGTSVRDIFERPTIARLAGAIRARRDPSGVPAIRPSEDGNAELSFAQRRLWFFDQMTPDSAAYNVSEMWRVRGPLDGEVLERVLRTIRERHDVLRTEFRHLDGDPYQVVTAPSDITVDLQDLTGLGAGAEDEAVRLANREGVRGFDLAAGPLIRAQLFKISDQHHCFALHFHHIVVDGWSMDVIWREISTLYDAYANRRPDPLPPLEFQYRDYAAWQRSWLDSEVATHQLEFWKGLLTGAAESLDLPADRRRPKSPSGHGRRIAFKLSPDVTDALRSIGQSQSATPFMVLLTAFDILLARHTGSTDIVTGSPVAGRVQAELENMVGFFVNTMALRLKWTDDPTFVELLERLRAVALNAQENQDVPFERVVEALAPQRDLSRSPVFQVVFALSGADEDACPAGWSVERMRRDLGQARFDLEMQLQESSDGLVGAVCYSTDLFDQETVQRLVDHFVTLCASVAADPRQPVSRLALFDGTEQDRILRDADGGTPAGELDGHLLELFEGRVASGPDVVALSCGTRRVTYRE
ncbi:condensation domain-containing protein, partial [Streptomyces sp. NPDC052236]|uniref:condensation domain-containing protein n=1 Tax=Streptomyces sp. NPDC052236 TaxID=3365686 RepID=UPI0037D07047